MKVMKGLTIEQDLLAKVKKDAEKEHRKESEHICYILEQWFQEKESHNGKSKKEK